MRRRRVDTGRYATSRPAQPHVRGAGIRAALRRSLKLALAVSLAAGLTGCWSKQELNDRTFVSTLLIDLNEQGETEVSTLFILPNRISIGLNAAPGSQKPYVLMTGKGRNIAEAFQRIQRDLPRNISWGQMRAIIIGDRYARAGLAPLFDYLIRATDFRLRVYMFYYDGVARELARLTPIFERFPTEVWRESAHSRRLPPVSIRDLLYAHWNNLGDAYIPELTLLELRLLTEDKLVEWSGAGGAAILRDNKVIGKFTEEEATGISFMEGRTAEMALTSALPEGGGLFSVRLVDLRPRTTAYRRGSKVVVRVSISGKADIVSIQSNTDLGKLAGMRTIEQALNARIARIGQSAADKAQAVQADVFQWSEFMRYKYPSLWRQVQAGPRVQLFTQMETIVDAHVELRSTGIGRSSKQSQPKGGLRQ